MKHLLTILTLLFFNISVHSQTADTCEMLSNNNYIGGLDCHLEFYGGIIVDSYQWLNCDNLFAPFPNDTTEVFSSYHEGSVALEITLGSCIDTSYCELICHFGINENQFESDIVIQPNPIIDFGYIISPKLAIDRFEILDMNGNVLQTTRKLLDKEKFDISELKKGAYMIRLYSDELMISKRIIKL